MEQLNLVKRCQNGDKQAFEELYHLYSAQALKTAYLISGHRGVAEDIVQEAFIQCYKEIKQLKEPGAFYAWFYKVLLRCGWRMMAKYQNKNSLTVFLGNYEAADGNFYVDDWVEAREVYDLVVKALRKLKAPLRAAVILYYYNNMTIAEIARVLGCVQGTVKSRLHNAKKALEKELRQYFQDVQPLIGREKQKEQIANG